MIKDPLYSEETPYELLGLNPNADHNEVQQALPKFIKNPENRPKIQKAMDAARKLRNPKERIEIDILHYCIGKIELEDETIPEIGDKLREFITVPTLDEHELFDDMKREDFSSDFREIEFNDVSLSELDIYDNIKDYKLEIVFDK